jgi:hypothetical protein
VVSKQRTRQLRRRLAATILVAAFALARVAAAQEVVPYDPSGRPAPAPPPPADATPSPPAPAAPPAPVVPPAEAATPPPPVAAPPELPQAADPEGPGTRPPQRTPPPSLLRPLPPPPNPPKSEEALGAVQIFAGTMVMGLSAMPILIGASLQSQPLILTTLAAWPLLGGWTVCGIGRSSTTYEGGCAPTMLGAYLGALTAIPLAALPCSSGGQDCLGTAALGFVVGYTFGTAVGATIGWHLSKRPRGRGLGAIAAPSPPPPGPSLADQWPELRRRPPLVALGASQGPQVSVPLLALSF